MRLKLLLIAGACLSSLTFSAEVEADVINACKGTSNDCKTVHIINGALITVNRVDITETKRSKAAGCQKRTWRIKRNLAGTYDRYDVQLNKACEYEIRFHVRDDCRGRKRDKLTVKNMKNGRNRFRLHGGCGSLKVTKRTGSESKSATDTETR